MIQPAENQATDFPSSTGSRTNPWKEANRPTMREYELTFIVHPQAEQEELDQIVERLKELIGATGGSVDTVQLWGLRRLAYPIQDVREGQYVFTELNLEPSGIPELERFLKLDERIIRHLIVRKEEK
jgi:small subunit ribosomal protein S6